MSMFHELMMRKKEQIMYATIKGTLTENDGVFSGFSSANYLALQQTLDTSKSFEVVIKVHYVGDSNKYFFGKIGYSITVGTTTVDSNRRFKAFFSSNGTSWNIGNITTTVNLTTNTDYYVKVGFTGTKYYIEQSTDGKNYVGHAELSSSENIISGNLLLGKSYLDEQYWNGSIDLPNSYIKLGSTKYNLQAVVGYTVVGSLTESPSGVFSGFSSANYLTCLGADAISSADNWEIVLHLINGSGSYFIGSNKSYALTISRSSGNIFLSSNGSSWDIANAVGLGVALPTDCYIKLKFTGTKYICEYSTDNINWVSVANIDSSLKLSTITYLKIGSWTGSSNYSGSIDLNNSYIKVNGKLWFNGQPA